MNEDKKQIKKILSKDEIQVKDILTLVYIFLKELKFYFFVIFIIASLILFFSILNKKVTYIAKANLLIEQNQVNNSSSNISKILGINNLPPQEEMFGPSMYTEIVNSQVFLSDLLLEEILPKENSNNKVKLYDLFTFDKSIIAPNNALTLGGYFIENLIKASISILLNVTSLPLNNFIAFVVGVSDMFLISFIASKMPNNW